MKDMICSECSSISSAVGIYDPIVCSQSINWLIEQIREANTIYGTATIQKNEAAKRLIEARAKAIELKKKIPETENRIEQNEKRYEKKKRVADYKQKIYAANTNMHHRQEHFADKILVLEKNLHQSTNRLSAWRTKLNMVMEDYKEQCKRLEEISKRRNFSNRRINSLRQHLTEMVNTVNTISDKQEFLDRKIPLLNEELDSINELLYDAETREMLAEQHVSSLRTYKETIKDEFQQKHIAVLDLKDRLELAKRKKKDLMRKNNIGHSYQLVG